MTQFLADQTTAGIIENNFSEAVLKTKLLLLWQNLKLELVLI